MRPLALAAWLAVTLALVAPVAAAENHTAAQAPQDAAAPEAPSALERFVSWLQLASALLFLLAVLRIAFILASNPIGEFVEELLYLRLDRIRVPALALLLVVLVETAELVIPFLRMRGIVTEAEPVLIYVNVVQGLLLVLSAVSVLLLLRHYTTRGLERRIEGSMDALATAQGQRRRRRLE